MKTKVVNVYNYIFKDFHPWVRVRVVVFNATFNNVLVISWRSDLLVEFNGETTDPPHVTEFYTSDTHCLIVKPDEDGQTWKSCWTPVYLNNYKNINKRQTFT